MTVSPSPTDVTTPLERAETLPPSYYTDPELYRLEEEVVFRRQWCYVCREDQVANAGDYVTIDLAGTPLVVVRGKDGELRALSASCLHRFMPVVEGQGNRTSFQCPYHLWTYALDGQLIGAPEMEQAEGFDMKSCRLPSIRVETWEGFVFVNLDEQAPSLTPQLATLQQTLREYRMSTMRTAAVMEYESDWNWKIMVENGIESYHHIGIHPDTLQPYFPAHTTSHDDVDGPYVMHRIPTKDRVRMPATFPVPDDLTEAQWTELQVFAVYPLMFAALQPDEMAVLQIIPQTVDRHLVRWSICYRPDAFDAPGFEEKLSNSRAILDAIHRQDIDGCARVQRGVTSMYARPGRLSHLEKGIWQFNNWLRELIAGAS
jgi:phenylpropionate dioxygenase-like ring-hydroxylating dioxygenase large terminal subunit